MAVSRNQSYIFCPFCTSSICCLKHAKTAKAETPVLWPPHATSWLTGKDSDAGRDWGQEEKGTTEDEMAGWHHRLAGRESEWTPGVGDGQGGLACCNSWGRKELDTTERLNWTESFSQLFRSKWSPRPISFNFLPLHWWIPSLFTRVFITSLWDNCNNFLKNYGRRFVTLYRRWVTKTIHKKRKCNKAKWLPEEALQQLRKEVKGKGEKERYAHLKAEFQRLARREKKVFLSEQCKEIEENNRMGKSRDLFKKIRDTKGTFSKNGLNKGQKWYEPKRSRRY